jgi:hypothetical protein
VSKMFSIKVVEQIRVTFWSKCSVYVLTEVGELPLLRVTSIIHYDIELDKSGRANQGDLLDT